MGSMINCRTGSTHYCTHTESLTESTTAIPAYYEFGYNDNRCSGGSRGTTGMRPPPPGGINSFIFMQFPEKNC